MKTLSVNELREQVAAKTNYDPEELKKLTKNELKKMLKDMTEISTVLDTVEVAEDNVEPKSAEPDRPAPTDPEWSDYVLEQLTDTEKDNGNPRVDGLRRVAEKLLGSFNSTTEVIQAPGLDGRATVLVRLDFVPDDPTNVLGYRTVCGAADVSTINTHRDFAVHAVATAETRAEGRALRKALRLTRVLAAEELQGPAVDEPKGTDNRVVTGMLNSLHMMCGSQGVDLHKLANVKYNVTVLEDLTHKQALEIADELSKYKRKEVEVPEEVKA